MASFKELKTEAMGIDAKLTTGFIELGRVFLQIKVEHGNVKLLTVVDEIGISHRSAAYYVVIYETVLRYKLPDSLVADIGLTRLLLLVQYGFLGPTRKSALAAIKKFRRYTLIQIKNEANSTDLRLFQVYVTEAQLARLRSLLRLVGAEFKGNMLFNSGDAMMKLCDAAVLGLPLRRLPPTPR